MNALAKGKDIEKRLNQKLLEQGFITYRAVYLKWMPKDIFGLWDIMAKHPKDPDKTFYYQVSTRWKGQEWFDLFKDFPKGAMDKCYLVKYYNGEFLSRELVEKDHAEKDVVKMFGGTKS